MELQIAPSREEVGHDPTFRVDRPVDLVGDLVRFGGHVSGPGTEVAAAIQGSEEPIERTAGQTRSHEFELRVLPFLEIESDEEVAKQASIWGNPEPLNVDQSGLPTSWTPNVPFYLNVVQHLSVLPPVRYSDNGTEVPVQRVRFWFEVLRAAALETLAAKAERSSTIRNAGELRAQAAERWNALEVPPDDRIRLASYVEILNVGLESWPTRLELYRTADGAADQVTGRTIDKPIFDAACGALHRHVIEDTELRACAARRCDTLFVRKEPRPGQQRSRVRDRNLRFCSHSCQRSEQNKRQRAKQAE